MTDSTNELSISGLRVEKTYHLSRQVDRIAIGLWLLSIHLWNLFPKPVEQKRNQLCEVCNDVG